MKFKELKNKINQHLKELKLANHIDGIRKENGRWEWAIETCYGELEWFSIDRACVPVEEYVLKLDINM
ncbi:MAG: hypothetical protein KAS32_29080 [Candidatus Peribacteraceae bacterium]|nr:hypothetical protein [Candidatus Peribacteraceae bacterium]